MAIECGQWFGREYILRIQLSYRLQMRLTRKRVHRIVCAARHIAVLLSLYAPNDAGTVA